MAGRRTAAPVKPVEDQAPEVVTENPSPEAKVENPAPETKVDEKASVPLDISSFVTVLDQALADADTSTGALDVASMSKVLEAYRGLPDTKNKTAAKKHVSDGMAESVDKGNINTARGYMLISKELTSAKTSTDGKTRTPKAPLDPTVAFVETAVRLRLAMVIHAESITDEIKPEWKDQVTSKVDELKPQLDAYATYLDSEDENAEVPEVDDLVVKAFKTVAGRAAGASAKPKASQAAGDGERRNIANHLHQAFEGKEVGTFLTIAQIRAFESKEYGKVPPSAGALTARLFPKDANGTVKDCTVEGIEGAEDESGHKGARKVA